MIAITVIVFIIAYVFIATEWTHRILAVLGGAALLLAFKVVTPEDAFYSTRTGIDWNVLALLLGMMIIVGVLRRTGIFEFTATWAIKRAKGSPARVMVILILIAAVASAVLDNVTTIVLIAPITLSICSRLDVDAIPFLIAEAIASNIGGTATLIGDPPNIIVAGRSGLTFNDFLVHIAPVIAIILVLFAFAAPRVFRVSFQTDPERVKQIMTLKAGDAITDRTLLIKAGVVLALVFVGFIGRAVIGLEPSVVALLGAGLLVLVSGAEPQHYLGNIEGETLVFFAGLFIMVGALVKTGVIDRIAQVASTATHGSALIATMLVLVVSAVLSGVVDNIPFVAAMSPVVYQLSQDIQPHHSAALWWALVLGADLGGNMTAIGASANVVVTGIAKRAGIPISFWQFTRTGSLITLISVLIAAVYLWVRYFLF